MTIIRVAKASKILYLLIWFLCIMGAWSLLPYIRHLNIISPSISFSRTFAVITIQTAFLFVVICWVSYLLVARTDLQPFSSNAPIKRIIVPAIISGILLGMVIYLLNATVFRASLLANSQTPIWMRLLASIYGGINEEVLLRLFTFTLIYFLFFTKIVRFDVQKRYFFLWMTNVLVAVLFGLGHLPATFAMIPPSSFEVTRILVLNGIPSIVFGWLFWSKSLWAAMAAHFVTDITLQLMFWIGG